MEPITFGKKKALLIKPHIENHNGNCNVKMNVKINTRHSEIISKLREFMAIRLWEKNEEKWSYNVLQQIKQVPFLIRPTPEKRNIKGSIQNCPNYFFFLTTIQSKKICCFVEKKKPLEQSMIYQVRFRFKDNLFLGTIISGSLFMTEDIRTPERVEITNFFSEVFTSIKREVSAPLQRKNWIFLSYDLWALNGKDISSTLTHRLVQVQDIIGKDFYPDSKIDICDFEIVNYYNYNQIEDFLRNKRNLLPYDISDHNVSFICSQSVPGIDEYYISLKIPLPKQSMSDTVTFKNGEWNVENCNSDKINSNNLENKLMYLKTSEYPDVYWVYDPVDWKKHGVAYVKTLEESKQLKQLFKNLNEKDYLSISCKWIPEFEKWKPINFF